MIHVFQQQKYSRQIHNPTHLFTTQTCKSWSYKGFFVGIQPGAKPFGKKDHLWRRVLWPWQSAPKTIFDWRIGRFSIESNWYYFKKGLCISSILGGHNTVYIFILTFSYESYLFFSRWCLANEQRREVSLADDEQMSNSPGVEYLRIVDSSEALWHCQISA